MQLYISDKWIDRLACVKCHSLLRWGDAGTGCGADHAVIKCRKCECEYQVREGILNCGCDNEFYQAHGFTGVGRHFPNTIKGRLGLYFARHHFLHIICKAVPAGAAVVEFGCGGGSRHLANCYDMLGLEISTASARQAAKTYHSAVQASVAEMPILSNGVDGIVSSFVLEHLDDTDVDRCFAEMARILKPNGHMFHLYDIDNDGPFYRWVKQKPWYRATFIDSRGHTGFRKFDAWQQIFDRNGFSLEEHHLFCKSWFQDLSIWGHLQNPAVTGIPHRLGMAANHVRHRLGPVADITATLIDDALVRLLPDRWAAKAIVHLRKRS